MVFQMAVIIFGGSYLGAYLDGRFEMKKPIFTATLALFSVFLAIYFVIKDFIRK
jgi:ATP synthase protein I